MAIWRQATAASLGPKPSLAQTKPAMSMPLPKMLSFAFRAPLVRESELSVRSTSTMGGAARQGQKGTVGALEEGQ
jgi:hypothetical protein